MSRPVDPEGLAARFIDLEKHETTHDRLVWGMRQNRDIVFWQPQTVRASCR
jgi:hypothetical protein